MEKISPSRVLYIKLGRGGRWEDECITRGTLRLGYRETPHDLCAAGRWDEVPREREAHRKSKGAASSDTAQIRIFYEAAGDVLWVTFWKHSLWWCFSPREITLLPDGTKERPTCGGWSRVGIDGRPLLASELSGKLLAIQGFQGTICSVEESQYVVDKINGVEPPELLAARTALLELERALEVIVRRLAWRDFELLVDLIFRQAGWQRVSDVGSTMKDLDLDLLSPITDERIGVQIKARADRRIYESYSSDRLKDLQGFRRFYFAVHTPSADLQPLEESASSEVELLLPSKIASLAARYGLTNWIIERAK